MASFVAMALGSVPIRALAGTTKQHHIEIRGFRFTPDIVTVKPGDTIIWTNLDIVPHTATAADNSWDTGEIIKGEAKKMRVTKTFSPDYFCRFHPAMKAKLLVELED